MARWVLPVPVPPTRTTLRCWAMKPPPARSLTRVWLIGVPSNWKSSMSLASGSLAEHIREALKAYRAHKLPKAIAGDDVAYAAARGERVQRLADVRRLRRFVRAVEAYE